MTRNILVHSDKDVPKRVLTAWSLGCPEQLIATAQVIDDELFVVACDHTLFRARSHGLSLKAYLDKIAEILSEGGEVISKVSTSIPQDTIDLRGGRYDQK